MRNGFIKGLFTGLGIGFVIVVFFTCVTMYGKGKKVSSGQSPAVGTAAPTPNLSTGLPVATATPMVVANVTTGAAKEQDDTGKTYTPTPTPVADPLTKGALTDEFFQKKMELLVDVLSTYYYKDVSTKEVKEAVYRAIFDSIGDPYTCYYSAKEYDSFVQEINGSYYGIGAYVSQNRETKVITITRPFEDGPADRAGLKAGDVIKMVEDVDVTDMDLSDVVAMMKGEDQTIVNITIFRETTNETIKYAVVRGEAIVPTVDYEMMVEDIGYIIVDQFDVVTEDQFKKAVDRLIADGAKGLIIDLRGNPGGVLSVTVEMSDYILPQTDLIVYTKDKSGNGWKYFSDDKHQVDLPIVVLVNGGSASASEIFTGALKDNGAAYIIGTKTFGKGIVQSSIPFTDGSAAKITTSSYYTPSGVCIHGIGITPDLIVEDTEDDAPLAAAIDWILDHK